MGICARCAFLVTLANKTREREGKKDEVGVSARDSLPYFLSLPTAMTIRERQRLHLPFPVILKDTDFASYRLSPTSTTTTTL